MTVKSRARHIVALAYGAYAWSVFVLVILFFGSAITLLNRPRSGRRIARFGARLMFLLARMPISARGLGKLPAQPHLLLVNHSSFLDGLALAALLAACPGYAFAVRQEFDSQRFLCPLLRSLDTLVLNRYDKKHSGPSNIDLMTAALQRGDNLLVFPEGGFSREPGLKRFHSGAFVAAAKANVPLVVAGLVGARTALAPGTWLPRRVAITLEIGPVFRLEGRNQTAISQVEKASRAAMAALSKQPLL